MRDFKAGRDINVGGDVYIHDESSQPKFLVHCTSEELLDERIHRKSVLSGERKRKFKRLAFVWLLSGVVLAIGALWFYTNGQPNFSSLLLGFGGLAVAFASVKVFERPNEFEQRQLDALKEIHHILRERGLE
ncbi:hypothetical protein [Comamonas kerstersii]|uniref:hypothetical protein n=1 Tax=Comamonas kerstersii TaxID=225992 RepID=UPI0026DBB930|nr:hypothetical protein [Comamonas kerstersii]